MRKGHRLASSVKILINPDLEFLHLFLHDDGWLNRQSVLKLLNEETSIVNLIVSGG